MPLSNIPPENRERGLEQNVGDLYKQDSDNRPLLHWIQKEAIQNSVDEIKAKDKFAIYFELKEHKNSEGELDRYLIIRDVGTSGMTGQGIPKEIEDDSDKTAEFLLRDQNERWGRFESLYHEKEHYLAKLGNKGRGKLVFIYASVDREIFFDSLREDNTYKFGGLRFKTNKRIISDLGENSVRELKNYLPFLEPLTGVGTRIIIKTPKPEIIENFSEIEEYIKETWWELLANGVRIFYKGLTDNTFKQVKSDPIFDFDSIPEENKIEKTNMKFGKHNEYKFEKLVIVLSDKKLDDYIQGISIQRKGMKITCYKPNVLLPQEISEKIYGYVKFTEETEKKFVEGKEKIESVTHYTYNYRLNLGKAINKLLDDKVREFAEEKGLLDTKEAKTSKKELAIIKNTEEKINKLFKKLGITGEGSGESTNNVDHENRSLISVIKEPQLKEEYDVNEILYFTAKIINRGLPENGPYIVEFKLYKDTTTLGTLVAPLFKREYAHLGSVEIRDISDYLFKEGDPAGKYLVDCRIVNKNTGEEVYHRANTIWYKTPPEKRGGLFKIEMIEDANHILYRVEKEQNGYTLRINKDHAAYEKASQKGDELQQFIYVLTALATPKVIQDTSVKAYGIEIKDDDAARNALDAVEKLIGNILRDLSK